MIEEGLAMMRAGMVSTRVVDVTGFLLEKLRTSDDPILAQSITALTGHVSRCSQTGVLQNEMREDS